MSLLPYLMLALLPAVLSGLTRYRPSPSWIALVAACFVLFMGFRDEVGPDWTGYLNLHAVAHARSWEEIVRGSEPLSMALFHLSDRVRSTDNVAGTGMIISNCVSSAILIFGVIAFARRTPLFWVAFSVCVPYLVIVFGMSGIRQAMAVGVTLFTLSRWADSGLIFKTCGVLLAALFHSSAIVLMVPVLLSMRMTWGLRISLAVPALAVMGAFLVGSTRADLMVTTYAARHLGQDQRVSGGAYFHIALVALPAILGLVKRRSLLPYIPMKELFLMGCVASVALVPLGLVSTTGASRLSLYLYFVPMLVYPAAVLHYFKGGERMGQTILCLSQALLLIAWLLTANTAWPYLPYRNYLF